VEITDPQPRHIRRATGRRRSDNRSDPIHGLYWPIPSRVLKSALSALSIVHQEYIFVDIGCGKGRALLIAEEYPFKAIIGLEKRDDLITIAKQVIARFGSNKTTVNIIHTDAGDFVLPGANCVLFLFNPFETESFEKFFANTVDALRNGNIEIVIIYVSAPPKHVAAIRDSAYFRPMLIERTIPTWTDFRVEFFRSVSR
jgi:SAM-dependent methyltransferase